MLSITFLLKKQNASSDNFNNILSNGKQPLKYSQKAHKQVCLLKYLTEI